VALAAITAPIDSVLTCTAAFMLPFVALGLPAGMLIPVCPGVVAPHFRPRKISAASVSVVRP
jgi:hypothetical protein